MAPRRFGLLGDIHAEDVLLQRALQHLHELGVDCILAVGDVVDGQGDVNRCVEMLSNEANLLVVLGNHERWLLRGVGRTLPYATQSEEVSSTTWSFIKALPATIPNSD